MNGEPLWLELELVRACDYRCRHCDVWSLRPPPDALTFGDWSRLLREIAAWRGGRAQLSFTTGEPFLHPRLLELVSEASRLGLDTFLNTHGGRIDAPTAEGVVASGLGALWVSLDGHAPGTHDASRGVPRAHERAVRAVANLRRAGYRRTGLVSIVMAHNLGELADLARWAGERGLIGVEFQPLHPVGRDWRSLWPGDRVALRRAFDEVEAARRSGAPIVNPPEQLEAMARYYEEPRAVFPRFDCRSARTLIVESDGQVRLCRFMGAIGRVQEASLPALWASAAGRARAAAAAACHESCVLLGCHFPVHSGPSGSELPARVRPAPRRASTS